MPRIANLFFVGIVSCIATMVLVAVWQSSMRANPHANRADASQFDQSRSETRQEVQPAANVDDAAPKDLATFAKKKFPVIIRKPSGPPRIELAGADPQGRTGSVACSTCHSVREANFGNKAAATLDEFHQGMTFTHGNVACYACHNPNDSEALRLADGSTVAFQNVMTVCSQCHSKQAESFAHGAHGGMNGHWDLNRGPQMKNNCIDCHDPHAPNYPKMIVGFKPKDRFNEPSTDPFSEPSTGDQDHKGAASHDDH